MERKCSVCHQIFESIHGRTICNDCFTRVLYNIDHPQDGVCPVCGEQSPIISKRRNKKYCSKRCSGIAHGVITRKYGIDNRESINGKKRERTMTTNLRHQSYVDHTGNVVLVD